MRKMNFLGMASVVALAACFSFSSCSKDTDDVLSGPADKNLVDGEVVKTQFSISVPAGRKSTRMGVVETQATEEFIGMEGIQVYTFVKGDPAAEFAGVPTIKGSFNLGNILAAGLSATSNAKKYNDVVIDYDVDHMVFYGKSRHDSEHPKYSQMTNDGSLEVNYGGKTAKTSVTDITFTPKQRCKLSLGTTKQGQAILAALNSLVTGSNWTTGDTDLGKLYDKFITLKAGSEQHVLATVQDLYNSLNRIEYPSATADSVVTDTLMTRIERYFTGGAASKAQRVATTTFSLAWKEPAAAPGTPAEPVFGQNFPVGVYNLPVGAAALNFNSTFSYAVPSADILDPTSVAWPADLYYFANSKIAVKDTEVGSGLTADKPWNDIITENYPKAGAAGKVLPTTKSVSMIDQVNYGVGLLKTHVVVDPNTIITDGTSTGAQPVLFPGDSIPVLGVLVGGQKQVGWDFTQATAVETSKVYTLYDSHWTAFAAKKTDIATAPYNPTLVLESTPKAEMEDFGPDHTVVIALEFMNTAADFVGKDNQIVKHGTPFYLTARLDPKAAKEKPEGVNAVFMKDYVTTVKLSVKDLKNAYVTIPDLRSPKMEFGLSVDLKWNKGFTFTPEFD